METLNIVCGADIHKRFLVATILSRDSIRHVKRFAMTIDGLSEFRDWVMSKGCERVAVESTGRYWVPVYSILEGTIEVIVANAYKIKHIPGRKTDLNDSEWIAELCLNNMIEPSRIFPKESRDLKNLTRARESYVNELTREKNRIHQALESCSIKLSSVLSDIFGKVGCYILNGLLEGKDVDDLLENLPVNRLKKKADQIYDAIKGGLDSTQILLIQGSLEHMKAIQKRIDVLDLEIRRRAASRRDDLAILMSFPGIGFTSAVTILAEIGNYRDFKAAERLASWCGLVPSVYQSADKLVTGCITKRGSRHIRWILVEVAHAIARTKNSELKRFFLRIRAKKGYNVAIVALARKVLCIIHHLLINREMYEDGVTRKGKSVVLDEIPSAQISLREMINCLVNAGYEVSKIKSRARE